MERRKVIKIFKGRYQLLKPTDANLSGWCKYGENKSLKSINDLLKKERFALGMSEEVKCDILQYRKRQAERSKEYFSKNGLESKTI